MKKFIIMTTAVLGLLSTVAPSAGGAQTTSAPDLCENEYKQIKDTPHYKTKMNEFKKICSVQSAANGDEQFLLKKWGKKICSALTSEESPYVLQCRYKNLLLQGRLSIAETLAVYGYTAQYYNYLTTENIQLKPGSANYEGYDVFNRVLMSAIGKLNRYPEYQFNFVSYRGTHRGGKKYKVSSTVQTIPRWYSSSCAKEIAFGPELIEKSEAEKAKIIAEEGEDSPGLEYLMMDRDPKSVPKNMNPCEEIYFRENPNPPVTPESHFGNGDLKMIFLPPANGISKRVAIHRLSTRTEEAEVLVPPGTQFQVVKVLNPGDPGGDDFNTIIFMQEVAP